MNDRSHFENRLIEFNGQTVGIGVNRVIWILRQSTEPPCWYFSIDLLEHLDGEGIETMRVIHLGSRDAFEAKLSDFQKHGIPSVRDGIPSLFLRDTYWKSLWDKTNPLI